MLISQKNQKKVMLLFLLVMVALIATGCVSYDAAGNPSGWVYEYIGRPTSNLLDFLANFFGGSYGVAIIIVTIITRLFMLPSSVKMTKDSMISQSRMQIAQPEIDAIDKLIAETEDQNEKIRLNNEKMAVYKKYNINMLGGLGGCLPLLIQMPIITAVYAAIRSSEQIKQSTFLNIQLGEKSYLIFILVVAVSFLQAWLMQRNMPQSSNPTAQQTSKTMLLMNPLMLGWITLTTSAGLGIYFLTGAIVMLIQQLYVNKIVRPRIQEMIDEEAKNHDLLKDELPSLHRKDVTPSSQTDRIIPTKQSRRNEGLQKRR